MNRYCDLIQRATRVCGTSVVVITLCCAGCARLGPRTIRGDRFNYNEAGAQSAKEQVLLNLVRLRYGEAVYFVELDGMLSQYTLEAAGSWSFWDNDLDVWENPALRATYGVDGDPGEQTTRGASVTYVDRPTITYKPLQGEEFTRRLMAPIPAITILYLIDSGWRLDKVFECCVQQINGVRNESLTEVMTGVRQYLPANDFEEMVQLLQQAQDAGALELGAEFDQDELAVYLYKAAGPSDPAIAEVEQRVRELLGLPGDATRLRLTTNVAIRQPDEIALKTRSLHAAMQALARAFDPPDDHVTEGQTQSFDSTAVDLSQWMQIRHSRFPNPDAFAQVRYNGYWFYIRKTDWASKRTLALLLYLLSLQADSRDGGTPLLTVPVGG
jgi:hypothetical protein